MTRLYLYAALLLLTQCSKCKNDPEPKDELPPATQTGANTFGCLVNGQVFTPAGNISLTRQLDFSYSPASGSCSLYAHRVSSSQREFITLRIAPMSGASTYSFDSPSGPGDVLYENSRLVGTCSAYNDHDITYRRGSLTFTRLDLTQRIASGTFWVTFARPGCDTIRLTDGRFDVKF